MRKKLRFFELTYSRGNICIISGVDENAAITRAKFEFPKGENFRILREITNYF